MSKPKHTRSEASFSLKDELFNRKKIKQLSDGLERASGAFQGDKFVTNACRGLKELQLKQRIAHIANALEGVLPKDFVKASKTLVSSLPPPLDPSKRDNDFGEFIFSVFGEYIVRNGMEAKNLATSLETLRQLTMRFSMEFAVRPFIAKYPDKLLKQFDAWSEDPHYHVRRLVSEGTRPSLPWAGKLELPFENVRHLLFRLHADETRFVTRSVANHLNDISKKDPELVFGFIEECRRAELQQPAELDWIIRHALRTLIKQGHPKAMACLGVSVQPDVTLGRLQLARKKLMFGETLEFEIKITARSKERLIVDYEVEFQRANGKTSRKVFKIKNFNLDAGESVCLKKRHTFKANATTYRLYPGLHKLSIQLNGEQVRRVSFHLLASG